ncbi:MAG: hypothetical protein IJD13_02965 [Oscillospiraceae bacterium]|nr:hypothetical protein [Oscillospiraceae bacterium]
MSGEFELCTEAGLQICYAPHNEYINPKAKILIVGITPGWSQTERAYLAAKEGIVQQLTDEEICFRCKLVSRFAGPMRKNLIGMLDELGLHSRLNISSCAELFSAGNDLLHTTSLIRYPCFYKGKNYSGHTPAVSSSDILQRYLSEFVIELDFLNDIRLIIPLGAAVEKILIGQELPIQSDVPVLRGFPHPSGLNAHRGEQFREHFEQMKDILHRCRF